MTEINLRAHHLLCTVLYKGKGYSAEFTANMDQVTELLKKSDTKVRILTSPDAICSACPNRRDDGGCALDYENQAPQPDENIQTLDKAVLAQFKINTDRIYTSAELFRQANERITPEFFETACGNCRWCKLGLCSFTEYKKGLKELIADEHK